MTNHINLHDRRQAGFTLVELAVVMIIIGLLIGGVLKGQQLIANAEIAGTATQIEGIDGAISTFRDMYNGMPGDIANNRIANCNGSCAAVAVTATTLNNGRIDGATPFAAASTGERLAFWGQLAASDVMGGIDVNGPAQFGGQLPESDVGGGYEVGYHTGTGALTSQLAAPTNTRAGHYIVLQQAAGGVPNGTGTGVMTPQQAFMLDTKLDDGAPDQGSVIAAGAGACILAATAPATGNSYNEANQSNDCNLYFRIQQ